MNKETTLNQVNDKPVPARLRSRVFAIATMAVLAVSSFATEPPEADFEPVITAFKSDITTMLVTYGPLVIGLLVLVVGWRFVVSWIRRVGRSSTG